MRTSSPSIGRLLFSAHFQAFTSPSTSRLTSVFLIALRIAFKSIFLAISNLSHHTPALLAIARYFVTAISSLRVCNVLLKLAYFWCNCALYTECKTVIFIGVMD